jgi:lipopolysaccharide biosynthesis regulator YciM
MKRYEGRRTIDGLVVTVDGKRLDEHYEVKRFTKYGFEWTYEGESPQQLALAILFDHLGEKDRAIRLSAPFMKKVIANLDNDWSLGSDDIDAFLRENDRA